MFHTRAGRFLPDAENARPLCSRIVQTFNVPQRVRLSFSFAAALLTGFLSILRGPSPLVLVYSPTDSPHLPVQLACFLAYSEPHCSVSKKPHAISRELVSGRVSEVGNKKTERRGSESSLSTMEVLEEL